MQSPTPEFSHLTVLCNEVTEYVLASAYGTVVDATLGLGGHSEAVLRSSNRKVIGIDQDDRAVELAKVRLAEFDDRFHAVNANFSEIRKALGNESQIGAIIADLGVSSMQLDDPSRGFSFRFDAPLDMRMNSDSDSATAAELLAELSEKELADVLYQFGEERRSRKIARWVAQRNLEGRPITTTADLANLVERAIGNRAKDKIHPATRTFQALRIAVNGELDVLEEFINDSADLLTAGGILAIITFHSLEDRIVKYAFQRLAGKCICPPRIPKCICGAKTTFEILTRKPVLPQEAELRTNPRSRSAKLRVARKLKQ